jgi:putative transcription factor
VPDLECEICGYSDADRKAIIEGAELIVCKKCAELGEEIGRIEKKKPKALKIEKTEEINPDFPELIKKSRESKGWDRKELAKRIGEKESVLARLEKGRMKPTMKIAEKLEKELNIVLIQKYEEFSLGEKGTKEKKFKTKTQDAKLTIGDVVEVK